jgi:hypothetical protein
MLSCRLVFSALGNARIGARCPVTHRPARKPLCCGFDDEGCASESVSGNGSLLFVVSCYNEKSCNVESQKVLGVWRLAVALLKLLKCKKEGDDGRPS